MSRFVKGISNSSFMPPKRKKVSDEEGMSFKTTEEDGRLVRQILMREPLRYLNDFGDTGQPARVMEKLRKAHTRYMGFKRESLKNGIRKILREEEIQSHMKRFFAINDSDDDADDDDDELVSGVQ